MKRVIDSSEVIGTVEMPEGICEVCATANAAYDEESARLIVNTDCFLRKSDILSKETHFRADWLPKAETIRESTAPEDTVDLAKDIFHRWTRKVRNSTPRLSGY